MTTYLLEIGTEEIPAHFMPGALAQLKELAGKKLAEHRLNCERIDTFGTPRRLALLLNGLAEKGQDLREEVRGPAKKAAFAPNGEPTKAAQGFARSQGVSVESLTVKDTGAGEYVYAQKEVDGRPAPEILHEVVPQLITGLNFPKPMRWGSQEMRFARPIRWLVSLLDGEVLPFDLDFISAGRITRGHRFLGSDNITLDHADNYLEKLKENFVMADQEERRKECWRQILFVASSVQGLVEEDEELLEEVTHLLEWPTALMGSFAESYLDIPEEAVITPMREHQRYFPVRGKNGKLLNRFITVRNGDSRSLEIVSSGNEKVLKARLADARFFWDEDRKKKLAEYLPKLEKVVFQESLGTVAQKIARIKANVAALAETLSLDSVVWMNTLRAAELAKADLVTSMVYEFPELQGIMGRYYALESGENQNVALAILEHYQPRFAGDAIPASLEGALVSIADKMDTIAGCFAIGIEPTGSQDPYALRRQAMGVSLILSGHQLNVKLDDLIGMALGQYKDVLPAEKLDQAVSNKIKEFFQQRFKNILTDAGHRYDVIDAVLSVDYNSLIATLARAQSISECRGEPAFAETLMALTRAFNLAKKVEKTEIKPEFFIDPAEKDLYEAVTHKGRIINRLAQDGCYADSIRELYTLAGPVNRFFDAVMVMAEDEKVRMNRLSLLAEVVELSRGIGDLSKIQ